MRRAFVAVFVLLCTSIVWQPPAWADNNKGTHDFVLLSAAEVTPGPGEKGTGGSGVDLYLSPGRLCWFAETNGITMPITTVHLHRGARAETGDVVVELYGPSAEPDIAGCEDLGRALMRDISTNLGDYYIDIHTETPPAGALRGQLDNGGRAQSSTELTGAQVVPGPGDLDPYASGFVSYGVSTSGRFCFSTQIDADYPVTVHLHRGAAGQTGELISVLYGPTGERDVLGCAELGPEVPRDMFKHAEDFYFDVHNAEYPSGALRGQFRS